MKYKYKRLWRKLAWMALAKEKEDETDAYVDLKDADPDLCVTLLHFPSVHDFFGIRKKLENCDDKWLEEFLEENGMIQLLSTLEKLSDMTSRQNKEFIFVTNTKLFQCIRCLHTLMNSYLGLEFVISSPECTVSFAKALCSNNITVKMELLKIQSAMCLYSEEGRKKVLKIMDKYKQLKPLRYRFSGLINEMRQSNNIFYTTTILKFINALIAKTGIISERMQIRNEFIGLQLLDILSNITETSLEDFTLQVEIFKKHKLEDEETLAHTNSRYGGVDINDPKEIFLEIFNKVCTTAQANFLLSILQSLLQLSPDDNLSDMAWEIVDTLTQRAVTIDTIEEGQRLLLRCKDTSDVQVRSLAYTSTGFDEVDGQISSNFERKRNLDIFSDSVETQQFFSDSDSVTTSSDEDEKEVILEDSPLNQSGYVEIDGPSALTTAAMAIYSDGSSEIDLKTATTSSPSSAPPPPPPPPPPPQPNLPTSRSTTKHKTFFTDVPQPSKKLKKLNWQKISYGDLKKKKNCIWNQQIDLKILPNYEEIQEMFAQKVTTTLGKPATEKADSIQQKNVISDPKLSMNIGILLRQSRQSAEEIITALKEGNTEILKREKLKIMFKYLPEDTEIASIKKFDGEISKLNEVDRYYILLVEVDYYALRIEIELQKATYNERVYDISMALENYKNACQDLLNSGTLKLYLLMTLKVGNYLNYGSYAGNAHGYKIASILKLKDTKANSSRRSFLNWIAEMIENNYPNYPALSKELSYVKKCNGMSLEQLNSEINDLKSTIKALEKRLKKTSSELQNRYKNFLNEGMNQVTSFATELKSIDKFESQLANYFVEDTKSFKLDNCISIFAEFSDQVDFAVKENIQMAEIDRKKKKSSKQYTETRQSVGNLEKVTDEKQSLEKDKSPLQTEEREIPEADGFLEENQKKKSFKIGLIDRLLMSLPTILLPKKDED